jgi:hypothetical protein
MGDHPFIKSCVGTLMLFRRAVRGHCFLLRTLMAGLLFSHLRLDQQGNIIILIARSWIQTLIPCGPVVTALQPS